MKKVEELILPDDLKYTQDHEWARQEGDTVRAGISDYAQDQLGDLVFLELPTPGTTLKKGDVFGSVESVKAVADIYMPVGGEIILVNNDLKDAPGIVNESPYDKGWMIVIKPSDATEMSSLMTKQEYYKMLTGTS